MQQLRERGLPAIAMSGYGSEEDIRASLEAGFTEHLTKPVDLTRLIAAIHRVTAAERGAAGRGSRCRVGVSAVRSGVRRPRSRGNTVRSSGGLTETLRCAVVSRQMARNGTNRLGLAAHLRNVGLMYVRLNRALELRSCREVDIGEPWTVRASEPRDPDPIEKRTTAHVSACSLHRAKLATSRSRRALDCPAWPLPRDALDRERRFYFLRDQDPGTSSSVVSGSKETSSRAITPTLPVIFTDSWTKVAS